MKRTIENKQITRNFWLYEFIEAKMPPQAVALNWEHIHEFDIDGYEFAANFLQVLRDIINERFRHENEGREIGITVTSAFRCHAWEKVRNRSGLSQHAQGVAVDIQPSGCSDEMATRIIRHLYAGDWPIATGHTGGFAVKWPTLDPQGRILAVGFLHYDFRSTVARWTY